MRRGPRSPALGYKSVRVESFYCPRLYRHRLRAGKFLQRQRRRVALRRAVRPGTLCTSPRSDHWRFSTDTDSRSAHSTSTPCLRLCAPATPRDRSSIHAFQSTALLRTEAPPSRCPDRHPTEKKKLSFLGLKTLRSCPGFQQRAVHRKMLVRGQAFRLRLLHHSRRRPFRRVGLQQAVAVLIMNAVACHTWSSAFNPTNQRNNGGLMPSALPAGEVARCGSSTTSAATAPATASPAQSTDGPRRAYIAWKRRDRS